MFLFLDLDQSRGFGHSIERWNSIFLMLNTSGFFSELFDLPEKFGWFLIFCGAVWVCLVKFEFRFLALVCHLVDQCLAVFLNYLNFL